MSQSRNIIFTFGDITLSAQDYSITAKDKLTQLAMITRSIKTVVVGKQETVITIKGKLPAAESAKLSQSLRPLVAVEGNTLTLDGAQFTKVTLDMLNIQPSKAEGFAQFTMEFHY